MILELVSCMFGYLITPILSSIGILSGKEGVIYYGEVHQDMTNKLIHFMFMLPTTFGTLLLIPSVFNLNITDSSKFFKSIYLVYITHYMTVDIMCGINISIIYYFPFLLAHDYYLYNNKNKCLKIGIKTMLLSLFIQEFLGHYLFEHKQSRIEGVFNAILYSPFYSVYGIYN